MRFSCAIHKICARRYDNASSKCESSHEGTKCGTEQWRSEASVLLRARMRRCKHTGYETVLAIARERLVSLQIMFVKFYKPKCLFAPPCSFHIHMHDSYAGIMRRSAAIFFGASSHKLANISSSSYARAECAQPHERFAIINTNARAWYKHSRSRALFEECSHIKRTTRAITACKPQARLMCVYYGAPSDARLNCVAGRRQKGPSWRFRGMIRRACTNTINMTSLWRWCVCVCVIERSLIADRSHSAARAQGETFARVLYTTCFTSCVVSAVNVNNYSTVAAHAKTLRKHTTMTTTRASQRIASQTDALGTLATERRTDRSVARAQHDNETCAHDRTSRHHQHHH